VVTFKLSTHTKFWSLLLFVSIIVLSLGLYVAYMWLSNYYFSDYMKGSTMTFYTNAEPYFLVIFCICFVLLIDGIMLTINFNRGSYASKMRTLIE
jgi:phospholipid-transporting ATPase